MLGSARGAPGNRRPYRKRPGHPIRQTREHLNDANDQASGFAVKRRGYEVTGEEKVEKGTALSRATAGAMCSTGLCGARSDCRGGVGRVA